MLQLAWPLLLLLAPLPWLARRLLRPVPADRQAALRVPFADDLAVGRSAAGPPTGWRLWLALLAWLVLLLACARPQWLGDPLPVPQTGRDLLLAMDISESMDTRDFVLDNRRVNRITATKAVAGDFIRRRHGDRVGLILFAARAYLQAPLSMDRSAVNRLLQESFIGLAGRETAIGDAIGLAVKRLRERPADSRVLILMTDGANTAGVVAPLKAAELAANNDIRIHTVGIGSEVGGGRQRGRSASALDEKTLMAIAEQTGGRYFRARETGQLAQIYAELDRLEPVEQPDRWLRPVEELFAWPLGLALSLTGLLLLQQTRTRATA